MADYWKSQARKYCDFCKCWIADNKPSVEFHEKGRRHQDNVAKKLKFITKKSRRDEKESVKTDTILKQMESAALDAYRKDMENNADLTSIALNKKLQEENLTLSGSSGDHGKKIWKEAVSEDGKTYYWNLVTNVSVWIPPKEGYSSLEDQKNERDEMRKQQIKQLSNRTLFETRLQQQEQEKEDAEARAAANREKMKARRVEPEPEPVISGPILPTGKTDAYGSWQKVETTSSAPVDLQLPQQDFEYYVVPAAQEVEPPPPKEFKEKTVESLGSSTATFKKRKFVSSAKKNSRQRLNDD